MQAEGWPILRVAVASKLRRLFDYLPPAGAERGSLAPGMRVRVPFGHGTRIGLVVEWADEASVPAEKLRAILGVMDEEPLLPTSALAFLRWAAEYFHHSPGEVLLGTLPPALRRGRVPASDRPTRWRLSEAGRGAALPAPRSAPVQARLLALLRDEPKGLGAGALSGAGAAWRASLQTLEARGWVEALAAPPDEPDPSVAPPSPPVVLNPAQQEAVGRIEARLHTFGVFLLDGVTGSGKTEVYLSLIEKVMEEGRQTLVLIPEIGLSPQLVARFRSRLGDSLAVLHSGLGDRQRLRSWMAARSGRAAVLVGTRSAVFTPLSRPGLVVVDEEHDPSFKQMDGFRYSARDLAVVLARGWGVPVVLGTATPSFESLHNVATGRYADLRLPRRAGGARMPGVDVIDLRGERLEEGVSDAMHAALRRRLERGEQSLLFVNRRGFAPVLLCRQCGWTAGCRHCDAHLVYHREAGRMRCHYCDAQRPPPPHCPECGGEKLRPIGLGTQRVAEHLSAFHPGAPGGPHGPRQHEAAGGPGGDSRTGACRRGRCPGRHPDACQGTPLPQRDPGRDPGRGPRALRSGLPVHRAHGAAPGAGRGALRARRATRPGAGADPSPPPSAARPPDPQPATAPSPRDALEERRAARLPPHTCMALLRAEAVDADLPRAFLAEARRAGEQDRPAGIALLGPVPALMERRAGRHRAQLLVESARRRPLQHFLGGWLAEIEGLASARRVRWSLDVDPIEIL